MKLPFTGFRRGYTLVEIIVAIAIFTAFGAIILTLVINVTNSLATSENKGAVDVNFHNMTSVLSPLVSGADFVYVFGVPSNNYAAPTALSATSPIATASTQTSKGTTGDILIAVYYANTGQVTSGGVTSTAVNRIVGICRLYNSTSKTYPIYIFDSLNSWPNFIPANLPSVTKVTDLVALLPTVAQAQQGRLLASSALAIDTVNPTAGTNGIFLYNGNGSGAIMMALLSSGQKIQSNGKSTNTQTVSSAYTYSISSRNLDPP